MAKTVAVKEQRNFKMHDNLLIDVIKRQAGSLWKAVIEGIMNAVDAGANKCEIQLDPQLLIIKDDGKGFRSREEIEKVFETFGQPHTAEEEKVFGQFRMGRGQLFAFGKNTWRSGTFEMVVDINKNGMKYDFYTDREAVPGCTITVELYQPLSHVAHADMLEQIQKNAKYVRFPCFLNGKQFTATKTNVTWDLEIAEADIRFRQSGDVNVYNQGIKICTIARNRMGVGADIVTKRPIMVNFARNDIIADCPVWIAIQKAVQKRFAAEATRRTRAAREANAETTEGETARPAVRAERRRPLNEEQRKLLINQYKDGQIQGQAFAVAKLFQSHKSYANLTLRQVIKHAEGRVTIPNDDYYMYGTAEKIHDHKLALVLDRRRMLSRFGASTGAELVKIVNSHLSARPLSKLKLKWVPYEKAEAQLVSAYSIIPVKELTLTEAVVAEVLTYNLYRIHSMLSNIRGLGTQSRQILIGVGPAPSWTDGSSFIALERSLVRQTGCGVCAWTKYIWHIVHELLHAFDSAEPHQHDETFYKNFYSAMTNDALGYTVWSCVNSTMRCAEQVRRRLPRNTVYDIERFVSTQQRIESSDLIVDGSAGMMETSNVGTL